MCNYPEYPFKDTKKILVPGNTDRKSRIIAVINVDILEKEFELVNLGKKSYIIKYCKSCPFTLGDIFNLIEYNILSNAGPTGRLLKVEVTNIHQVDMELHIISFKPIKE